MTENNFMKEIKHVIRAFIAWWKPWQSLWELSTASRVFTDLLSNSPKRSPRFSPGYEGTENMFYFLSTEHFHNNYMRILWEPQAFKTVSIIDWQITRTCFISKHTYIPLSFNLPTCKQACSPIAICKTARMLVDAVTLALTEKCFKKLLEKTVKG